MSEKTYNKPFFKKMTRRPFILFVYVLILFIFLFSLVSPYMLPSDPMATNLYQKNQGISEEHIFGTDYLGRDLLSRTLCGLQTSMLISFSTIVLTVAIGVTVGAVSGYMGGIADDVISRVIDIFLAFPTIILALALCTLIGSGVINMILLLAIIQWASFARVMRGQVLSEKNQEYILSARTAGLPWWRILLKHILPNTVMPVIIMATIDMGHVILTVSTLSFLGLGLPPDIPEWGSMINAGLNYMRVAPLNVIVPGLSITLITLLFNIAGESLRSYTGISKEPEAAR